MIAVLDYGMGNLRSVSKAVELYHDKVKVTSDIQTIRDSQAIILPGVGAFAAAMKNLEPLQETILEEIKKGKPFLGICLGLQLIYSESNELGGAKGFDILPDKISSFRDAPNFDKTLSLPQIGWNDVIQTKDNPLFKDMPEKFTVYFVHTFFAPISDYTIGKTIYNFDYTSAVQKDNVFAVQFHPEKSSTTGLKILENFVEIAKK